MDYNRLLNVIARSGKLLIEHGAEIYRVEETMVHLCRSFQEVEEADSYVIPTGIMLSMTVNNQTYTRIVRVHHKELNLDIIHQVNALSREAVSTPLTLEELETRIAALEQRNPQSLWKTLAGSCIGAFGFALFFQGTILEAIASLLIAIGIVLCSQLLNRISLHTFFVKMVASATAAFLAILFHMMMRTLRVDIMIISSIMLLVPGLAITNAIRDTMYTDYVSGVARALEALISAVAIAVGVVFILTLCRGW